MANSSLWSSQISYHQMRRPQLLVTVVYPSEKIKIKFKIDNKTSWTCTFGCLEMPFWKCISHQPIEKSKHLQKLQTWQVIHWKWRTKGYEKSMCFYDRTCWNLSVSCCWRSLILFFGLNHPFLLMRAFENVSLHSAQFTADEETSVVEVEWQTCTIPWWKRSIVFSTGETHAQ